MDNLTEASGVAFSGEHLVIVSDSAPGVAFLSAPAFEARCFMPLSDITTYTIPNARLAVDLESIDQLPDGRFAVLSERLRMLLDSDGAVLAEYADSLAEFAERGLEGLAIKTLGDHDCLVAVLWEGGYPEFMDIPTPLKPLVGRKALPPVVWTHSLNISPAQDGGKNAAPAFLKVKTDSRKESQLQVPLADRMAEPNGRRFRGADLVWEDDLDKEGLHWIVLLSSQNMPEEGKSSFGPCWLQRFDREGHPLGEPLHLDEYAKHIGAPSLAKANWEGLGWLVENESLVLVHDKFKGIDNGPYALLIDLRTHWPLAQ